MRLSHEGEDLPTLLAHIQATYGDGVQIVETERLRSGGVMGFFAKEMYRVTIDVPEEQTERGDTMAPRHFENSGAASPRSGTPHADAEHPKNMLAALIAAAEATEADDLRHLAEPAPVTEVRHTDLDHAADDVDPIFAHLLHSAEQGQPPASAEQGQQTFDVRDHAPIPEETMPAEPPTPVAGQHSMRRPETPALRLEQPTSGASPHRARSAYTQAGPPSGGGGLPTPNAAQRLDDLPMQPGVESTGIGRLRRHVRDRGLPKHLADRLPSRARLEDLLGVLQELPECALPISTPGLVAAVIGATATTSAVATRFGSFMGSGQIPVADMRTVTSMRQARAGAERIRSHDEVGALSVPVRYENVSGAEYAASVVRACAPDIVILCVDAGRKHTDTRAFVNSLRAQDVMVDGLAVVNARCTAEPATVLELGLPVWEIDGALSDRLSWLPVLLAEFVDSEG